MKSEMMTATLYYIFKLAMYMYIYLKNLFVCVYTLVSSGVFLLAFSSLTATYKQPTKNCKGKAKS